MENAIPSVQEVRERLQDLSWGEVKALCARCNAPFTTVWKLRTGETASPMLETVRLIWPDLQAPKAAEAAHG